MVEIANSIDINFTEGQAFKALFYACDASKDLNKFTQEKLAIWFDLSLQKHVIQFR